MCVCVCVCVCFFPQAVYGACLLKVRALRAIQHWVNTAFDLALTLLFPKVTLLFPCLNCLLFFVFSCYVYLRQLHHHLQLSRTIPAGDQKKIYIKNGPLQTTIELPDPPVVVFFTLHREEKPDDRIFVVVALSPCR